MSISSRCSNLLVFVIAALFEAATFGLKVHAAPVGPLNGAVPHEPSRPHRLSPRVKAPLDRSGRRRFGKASFYAHMFAGRKMADGKTMDPRHNNAASRTLPLGTTAKVTNLETGKSAVVTIQDRGPYVDGRIVDLSPATAEKIGITRRQGVAKVEVAPIAVPLPNGGVKLGMGADARLARNYRADHEFPPVGW
ncbi:MAG TPA: septal ring lytic transglycosylase RlpA family protein [Steroidobacteraceae bacterium]|nr:septal ring lytic transglycosylase RlpA family protein [Steroidobacteraceae bacterium]